MEAAQLYRTTSELERGLADVVASPREKGRLEAIVLRPRENERQSPAIAVLTPEGGVLGDRWATEHPKRLTDGRPDPQSQVSLMNVRILSLLAGIERQVPDQETATPDAMCLAGDNLIVDLDLSEANLPAGSRLQIGTEVVLEMTAQPHTGCAKFSSRYGKEARAFINSPRGKSLNLRGRYARVVRGGTISVGDPIARRSPAGESEPSCG